MRKTALWILLLVTLLFFSPVLFSNGILGNFGDIYQYAAPFRFFSKVSFQSGAIPLWNPYIFSGAPFLASPQSSLFYPLTPLFYFFRLQYAFNFFTALHFFLNALGMFLLLRVLGRTSSASIWGALAWGFSFHFLAKCAAGHVIHLSGYAWTPYVLLFFMDSIDKKNALGFSFLGFLTASLLQFFSGHLQVWLLTELLLLIYLIFKMGSDWKGNRSFYMEFALNGFIAFSCCSLVQILPTLIYAAKSTRLNPLGAQNLRYIYEFASSYSLRWKSMLEWLAPGLNGNPLKNNYAMSDFPSEYFETEALFIGTLPFLFAFTGILLLLKRKKFFLPLIVLFSLLIAGGRNSFFYNWFWRALAFLRVPARFYLLTLAGLIFSATYFWDYLFNRGLKNPIVIPAQAGIQTERRKGKTTLLKFSLLLITVLELYARGKIFIYSEDPILKLTGRPAVMGWLQTRSSLRSKYRIFSTLDLGKQNKTMFYGIKNSNGYEAILQDSLLHYFSSTQTHGIVSTTGVDVRNPRSKSFSLDSVKYLVSTLDFSKAWPLDFEAGGGVKVYQNPDPLYPVRPVFKLVNVGKLESVLNYLDSAAFEPDSEIIRSRPYYEDSSWMMSTSTVWEKGAPIPPSETYNNETLPVKPVSLTEFERTDPDRMEMVWKSSETCSFWIFLSEAFYPGWECWSETGEHFNPFMADGYFQGCLFNKTRVPDEKIFWVFRPADFSLGSWVSAISLASLTAIFLLKFKRYLI